MDRKKVEFSKSIDPSIDIITGTTYLRTFSSNGPKAITIFHDNEVAEAEMPKVSTPVLVVEVPNLTRQLLLTSLVLEALPETGDVMPLTW